MNRRRLFGLGAVATLLGWLRVSAPVSAADGDDILAGQVNDATATTDIEDEGESRAFLVTVESGPGSAVSRGPWPDLRGRHPEAFAATFFNGGGGGVGDPALGLFVNGNFVVEEGTKSAAASVTIHPPDSPKSVGDVTTSDIRKRGGILECSTSS